MVWLKEVEGVEGMEGRRGDPQGFGPSIEQTVISFAQTEPTAGEEVKEAKTGSSASGLSR